MTALCPGSVRRGSPSSKIETVREPDDSGVSFSNFNAPSGQHLLVSNLGKSNRDEKSSLHTTHTSIPGEFQHRGYLSNPPSYPSRSPFTATNADSTKMDYVLYPTAVSPLQTRFDDDPVDCDSYVVDPSAYSATSMAPSQWSSTLNREAPIDKWRRGSIRSQFNSTPCTTERSRTSGKPDFGPARAVYLEKNRKAASKCRTKQKRQQEDLVEAAREVERRNKVLKSEVEFLKSDLRDLMELVGKHNECPDSRLRRYVQLEADRLSAQSIRSPIAEVLSAKASSSEGSSSPHHR